VIALFRKFKLTIKREFFVTGLLSAVFIATIFIALFSLMMYFLSIDNAHLKLRSDSVHLSTYTEGVLESLAASTNISALYSDVMSYQKEDQKAKEKILSLFSAITEANSNIKFCFAGFESGELLIEGYIPPEGYDPRVRPWYVSAVEKYPELSIGIPYQEAKTSEWLISVSRALVNEEGVLQGVVSVDCTLEYVKQLLDEVGYYQSQTNFILDDSFNLIVHQNTDYLHQHVNNIVPELSNQFSEESGYIAYSLDGIAKIAYYQKLNKADWIVVTAVHTSEIIEPLLIRIGLTVIALIVLAIFLGLIQVKLYERSFVKPINSLRDRIAEITTGKKVEQGNCLYSNQEIAEIANRIEAMAETSLRKKADELELILASTSDGMLVVDLEGNVIHANQKFKEMWSLDGVVDFSTMDNLLLLEQISSHKGSLENTLNSIHLPNGTILEQFSCPLMDDGSMAGRLWSYRNVTEQFRAEESLKLLATTDALTGVWNRRQFMTQGAFEIELVKRTGSPLSLIFLDIDFFKQINDTFGHQIGDEALIYLTSSLKKLIRKTDMVARLGGEEFCILVPNTALQEACVLAEKIRIFFERQSLVIDDRKVAFTLSLGVTSYYLGCRNIDDLLNAGDKACYEAKAQGRNRVVAKSFE
jgi:diguanylate cyclase (GGDEF)-like protein